MSPTMLEGPRRRCEVMKRGKRFVRKHVGTDSAMSVMALRRSMGQTLRHMVELNHRSEVHYMLVAYDPRNDNPSLTFYGSRDIARAALRSTLKDEICQENLPKQLLKNTIRVPVFSPRDPSELEDLVDKEREENALTLYFYKEMQRCTFPMHFFKIKANDSWIPRRNVAFWPPDLEVHTLHESGFGTKIDGTRFEDRTDCLMYMLEYIKEYYHNVVLKSLQLQMQHTEDGFAFVNCDNFPEDDVDRAMVIVGRELCTRMFVSWVLNPLRPLDEGKQSIGRHSTAHQLDDDEDADEIDDTHETTSKSIHDEDDDDELYVESTDIDVCGTDENLGCRRSKIIVPKDVTASIPSTSTSWQNEQIGLKELAPTIVSPTKTVLIAGKRVTMRRVTNLQLPSQQSQQIPIIAPKPEQAPFRFIKIPSSRLFGTEPSRASLKRPYTSQVISIPIKHSGSYLDDGTFLNNPQHVRYQHEHIYHHGEVVLEETVSTLDEQEVIVDDDDDERSTTMTTTTGNRYLPLVNPPIWATESKQLTQNDYPHR
ncbi:unnamed protein product, partial [Mesorhabditis belari]|uniref:Uncharacterized protein n=1 Tax=Mesorhabditis belari TaxID=2138241 RepID=A0AAF3EMD7_9BILA